jgi:hypothetical protein
MPLIAARKSQPTEWLLARFIGNDRASVILGDLLEMKATRGSLWFWTAYIRTLISLGWRTPVALVLAVVSINYVRPWLLRRLVRLVSLLIGNSITLASLGERSFFHSACWTLALQTAFPLWIVMPYVAIRFGLRNRLTYLAFGLFLVSVPVYGLLPRAVDSAGVLTAFVTVAAFALPLWRRPMVFLAINCAIQYLISTVSYTMYQHGVYYYNKPLLGMRIDAPVQIAVMVIVGPFLHRWLLESAPSGTAPAHLELL